MQLINKTRISFTKNGSGRKIYWALFECPFCKKYVEKEIGSGRKNHSCGCKHFELLGKSNTTHGDAKKLKRRLYRIYYNMKARCYNPNMSSFRYYGQKGIRICEEWHKYVNFKNWALSHGYKEDLSIDRICPDDGYHPENCRWIPLNINGSIAGVNRRKLTWQQYENIRLLYKSNKYSQAELGKIFNMSQRNIGFIVRNETCKFKTGEELLMHMETS
ncbi:MAG: HNH catalytic motif-containing protein [Podoviridae sp. cty5g4]|nr:MAG: HNH catalytic motif-containing protein [Podoviridae sp. cty5g4]